MDFSKIKGKIFINNKFYSSNFAKIHILNHSLHFSGSVFEGIRVYKKKILFLEEHIDRLIISSEMMKLNLNINKKEIMNICEKIIKLNKISDGYIRPIVFRSNNSMSPDISNCTAELAIAAWKWGNLYKKKKLKIDISKYLKPDNKFFPIEAKSSGSYQGVLVAKEIAREKGYDDILLLDRFNYLKETSACNIFWIKKNTVYTPRTNNILNGITRRCVIKICRKNKIKIKEGDFKLKDLKNARNMFLTGTAAEIVSVWKFRNKVFKKDCKILNNIKESYNLIKKSGISKISEF